MVKEKYFVDLQSQEISQSEVKENHGITIYATQSEVELLRKTFNKLQSAEFTTFLRSAVPIMLYHNAKSNDQYDESFTEALKMLYNLGDEDAKKFIEESGVLGDRPIDTAFSYPDKHSHSDK